MRFGGRNLNQGIEDHLQRVCRNRAATGFHLQRNRVMFAARRNEYR
jgi:hypothetical protein